MNTEVKHMNTLTKTDRLKITEMKPEMAMDVHKNLLDEDTNVIEGNAVQILNSVF